MILYFRIVFLFIYCFSFWLMSYIFGGILKSYKIKYFNKYYKCVIFYLMLKCWGKFKCMLSVFDVIYVYRFVCCDNC